MTYLIGVILVLLLIALVLVFRPPKQRVVDEKAQQDFLDSREPDQEDHLILDDVQEESKTDDVTESVLTFDAPDEEVEVVETGVHEEEELSLTFDEPENDQGIFDESAEELTLDLEEDVEEKSRESESVDQDEELYLDLEDSADDATAPVADVADEAYHDVDESKDRDYPEEDIPLIEEGEDSFGPKGEMAPALADVPDDFAELDEDEAPEELAERLDYFLGTDEQKEAGLDVEEPVAEPVGESVEEETQEEDFPSITEGEAEKDITETVEPFEEIVPDEDVEGEEDIAAEGLSTEPDFVEELLEETTEEDSEEYIDLEHDRESQVVSDITDDSVVLEEEAPEVVAEQPAEIDEKEETVAEAEEFDVKPAEESEEEEVQVEELSITPVDEPEADLEETLELSDEIAFEVEEGAEEKALEAEEPDPEPVAEEIREEEKEDLIEETVEEELVVEAEPRLEAGPEDLYSSWLAEQVEKLHTELNDAIQNQETGKLGMLGMALENICTKQADISTSFQIHQKMLDGVEGMMTQLQQSLPGFQLEAAKAGLRNGEYEVVQNMLADAVNQLEGSPQVAAMALYYWGRFEEERGDFAAAHEMFSKGCVVDSGNLQCMFASGRLARIAGDMDNALSLLEKRVAAGMEKSEESVEMARARYELAKTLAAMDTEPERVEQLLTQALEAVEKALGAANPNLGPVLHELAVFHDSAGRYEQAEPLYIRALEVVEQALGSDSPRLGLTLNKLAGLYEELEQADKSEPLYTRALEIRRKVLGENHPDIGSIMGQLANLLKAKGKFDQAEPLYRKSLEISEVALGKDHPNLAMVLNDMAELYSEMGNQQQAEYFQERAYAAFGIPGMGDGFVEMEKDTGHDEDDDNEQTIAGD